MSKITLPDLPAPFDYCYEWYGPYGTRKFSFAPHNGCRADRTVTIYTAEQLQADRLMVAEHVIKACAEICRDNAKEWLSGYEQFERAYAARVDAQAILALLPVKEPKA